MLMASTHPNVHWIPRVLFADDTNIYYESSDVLEIQKTVTVKLNSASPCESECSKLIIVIFTWNIQTLN